MTLALTLDRPWLTVRFPAPRRVLSWALHRPGFVTTPAVTWREVRNADLPREFDVAAWMPEAFAARGARDHVGFLTSRDVRRLERETTEIDGMIAECVATVGLSNAEAVGSRLPPMAQRDRGTINILVHVGTPLADPALVELVSIVAQARTAAVMAAGHQLPTGLATGTGTDCIAVAAPQGTAIFAGLHTAVGEAVGRATRQAVERGAAAWVASAEGGEVPDT